MIQISAAGKRFGHKLLFENADWLITRDDRIGEDSWQKSTMPPLFPETALRRSILGLLGEIQESTPSERSSSSLGGVLEGQQRAHLLGRQGSVLSAE